MCAGNGQEENKCGSIESLGVGDVGATHTSTPTMSPPLIDGYNRKKCACGDRNANVEMRMWKNEELVEYHQTVGA